MAEGAGSCAARAAPRALADAAGRARVARLARRDRGDGCGPRRCVRSSPSIRGAAALLEAIASSSPYLWDLARADPDRLVALAAIPIPTPGSPACLGARRRDVAERSVAQVDAMRFLREMKAEAALLIALADIGGMWERDARRRGADRARRHRRQRCRAPSSRRAPPGPVISRRPIPSVRRSGSGYVVLAMGKMGAGELNYSSDIDLIVLFDPDAPALVPGVEPAVLFVRLTRQLVKAAAGAHRRRATSSASTCVCVPIPPRRRSRCRSRPALDYYESRGPELGTRRHDQGASLRRRHRRRAALCSRTSRPSSGANISISSRSATSTR